MLATPAELAKYDPLLPDAIAANTATGCWEWTRNALPKGYGLLHRNRRTWRAHRWVWTLTNGPIPEGLVICHKCDNPPCVNPNHLFLGTQADNMRDMRTKGRGFGPPRAERVATHCRHGHPYSGHNLIIRRGKRDCRACGNRRHAVRHARPVTCALCQRESTEKNIRRHLRTVHLLDGTDLRQAVMSSRKD